jgi:sugar fermentation stimulation protein A
MKLYHHLTRCTFLRRVNRFIAVCLLDVAETTVHVKNTGRLGELLLPGAAAWLEKSGNPARKTAYDLVAVEKDGRIVNIDSQIPNAVAREWVENGGWCDGLTELRGEFVHGDSRFDLAYLHGGIRGLIEVKGVTLFDESGMAVFPDAPTARGSKHLHGLIQAARSGMETGLIFVIMKEDAVGLRPNAATDPAFAAALRQARDAGVRIECCVCRVTADSCTITGAVPLCLEKQIICPKESDPC